CRMDRHQCNLAQDVQPTGGTTDESMESAASADPGSGAGYDRSRGRRIGRQRPRPRWHARLRANACRRRAESGAALRRQARPADQRAWMKQMSSEPNQVGSPHDKANAEFMLKKFREWGWDA